jgi:Spy/CpxP family protein refolding chaperone
VLVPSACGFGIRRGEHRYNRGKNFVTAAARARSCLSKARRSASKQQTKQTMKRNLLAVVATGAIALAGFAIVQAQGGPGDHGRWQGHALSLEQLTKTYNLTSDQQSKIKPLLDQARPQIIAIHKDAMQKTQTLVDSTMSQIRPLLNSTQQAKFDAVQKAKQDMRNSMQELHSAIHE